ncbi:MAG: peptide chain release factor N(5)-glutamine methyltransferase [Tibeticola sp.]
MFSRVDQPPPATLAQALALARRRIDALDAQMLLLRALGRPVHERAWLLAHDRDALEPAAAARYAALVERRTAGEPLAYLVGEREFFGLRLQVDERVLDPRPDTETLVHWALDCLADTAVTTEPLRVLDLGTGSGAIALALAHAGRDAGGHTVEVAAVDASADALAVAAANAQHLGLPLRLLHGDWFAPLAPGERFALIVSNPPYIAESDPHLGALRHEPMMALTSGTDGLDALRHIVRGASAHLRPGAWLLLEHGWDQAHAVHELLRAAGFTQVRSRHDLAGHARCSGGCWCGV